MRRRIVGRGGNAGIRYALGWIEQAQPHPGGEQPRHRAIDVGLGEQTARDGGGEAAEIRAALEIGAGAHALNGGGLYPEITGFGVAARAPSVAGCFDGTTLGPMN